MIESKRRTEKKGKYIEIRNKVKVRLGKRRRKESG